MRKINFFGLGFELGQEHRGLSQSADYIRGFFSTLAQAGLHISDQGGVSPQSQECSKVSSIAGLDAVAWSPYRQAFTRIRKLLRKPQTLLNWGGDHSVAIATVGAFCSVYPSGYVLWIDAHGDLNLPGHSPSGNLHGMPLSVLLDLDQIRTKHFPWLAGGLASDKLIYVGLRDLDPFEKKTIRDLGISHFTCEEIRTRGMSSISKAIYNKVKDSPLHISFDIDSLDPDYAASTGVPVAKGLRPEDLKILATQLSAHPDLCSIDVVEINPSIGREDEVFRTFMSGVNFLVSLLLPSAAAQKTSARVPTSSHSAAAFQLGN